MGILNLQGKAAGSGPIVVYQLVTGPVFYSETAQDDGDCFIFDATKTVLIGPVQPGKNGQAAMSMQKLSEAGVFHPAMLRVPKTSIAFMHDVGNPEVSSKVQEALSGLILPTKALPDFN